MHYGFKVSVLCKKALTDDEVDKYFDEYLDFVETYDDLLTGGGMDPAGLSQYLYFEDPSDPTQPVEQARAEEVRKQVETWLNERPWGHTVRVWPLEDADAEDAGDE